jgi:hypothetical protein
VAKVLQEKPLPQVLAEVLLELGETGFGGEPDAIVPQGDQYLSSEGVGPNVGVTENL